MPKYELKTIQKELEQGKIWPVYWLYGQEGWKSREVLGWIRKAVFGGCEKDSSKTWGWGEETLEGSETTVNTILDTAQSLSLGASFQFITIRDAHLLKESEALADLFGTAGKKEELNSVCVFIAKELDGRKKFSKQVIEKAAVVPCEEIGEASRETWVQYLAKRKGQELSPDLVSRFLTLDPWSLDRVEQEIEKWVIGGMDREILSENLNPASESQDFVDVFFRRDLTKALGQVSYFASQVEESLPLLGFLGWHLRQLILFVANHRQMPPTSKSNPYLLEKLRRWSELWTLEELLELQQDLAALDFSLKQTAASTLGLWTGLVARFCMTKVAG